MKSKQRLLPFTAALLFLSAPLFAQSTTTTPAGSSATGGTASGGTSTSATTADRPTTTTPAGSAATGAAASGGTSTTATTADHPPTTTPVGGSGTGTTASGGTSNNTTGTTAATTPANGDNPAPHTPNEHASDNAKAVQSLLQKFDTQRDQFIADRKALIDKLQAAKTDEERKAILDQLRTEQESRQDEQRALAKEIRDELKKLREQRKSGGS